MAGSDVGDGFPPGGQVAGYRLEGLIGRGGMAVVFRAFDETLNRQVAVKILAPALAADEEFRQRFIRESRSAAMVDDPHIIPIFSAGEADGALYIAMRYVPTGDMGSLVRREGPLPPGRATAAISAVASALDSAHGAGLVHRDVKPANMLVDLRPGRPDHVYLADFGLAKGAAAAMTNLTGTDHFLGTLDYCAPEQIHGQPVDGRADQYALACSALTILAGAPPFAREDRLAVLHAQLTDPPARLADRMPGVPAAVDEVLGRALAKAPGDRYQSCGEFAAELRAAFRLSAFGDARDHGHGHPATEAAWPGSARAAPGSAFGVTQNAGSPRGPAPVPAPAPPTPPAYYYAPVAGSTARRPRRPPGLAIAALVSAAILAAGGGVAAAIMVSGSTARSSSALAGASSPASTATGSPAAAPTGSRPRSGTATPENSALSGSPGPGPGTAGTGIVSAAISRSLADPGSGVRHVNSVAVSPNGAMVVTGDSSGDAFLWSASTGQLLRTLSPGAGAKIFAVAVSPDSALVATGASNGRTYLWSAATGQLAGSVADPGGTQVDSVAFSPGGTTLATGDGNGGIFLWAVSSAGRSATLARTLSDPLGAGVWALTFSPGGTTLAAGDYQDTTCLWNLGSGASPRC